jgi:hypothetical protein
VRDVRVAGIVQVGRAAEAQPVGWWRRRWLAAAVSRSRVGGVLWIVIGLFVAGGVVGVGLGVPEPARAVEWFVQPAPAPLPPLGGSGLGGVSCVSTQDCVAVGYGHATVRRFPTRAFDVTLAERWDGTRWSIQPTPNPPVRGPDDIGSELDAVSCASRTACMAVGYRSPLRSGDVPFAERWDGARWQIEHIPLPANASRGEGGTLRAVSCPSSSACVAVGQYGVDYYHHLPFVEVWDGRQWAIHPTPVPEIDPNVDVESSLEGVSCLSTTDCIAVGYSSSMTTFEESVLAERWDGSSWTILPANVGAEAVLRGVSCSSSTCTAVGASGVSPQGQTLALRWDGSAWTLQNPLNQPPIRYQGRTFSSDSALYRVSCPSVSDCAAVGTYLKADERQGVLIENWDGANWSIQPTPSPEESSLADISCISSSVCTAVGSTYATGNGNPRLLIESTTPPTAGPTPLPGHARLTTPSECVAGWLMARVTGKAISGIRWSLDGKRIEGRTVRRGRRYSAMITLTPGPHRLAVKVKFNVSTYTPTRTFHRTLLGCRAAPPRFTG